MPTLGITGKLERIRLYGCLKNPLYYNVIYLSSFSTFVPNVFISFKTNEIKSTTICSYWSSSKILKQHCLVGINYNLYFVFSEVIFVSSLVEFCCFTSQIGILSFIYCYLCFYVLLFLHLTLLLIISIIFLVVVTVIIIVIFLF